MQLKFPGNVPLNIEVLCKHMQGLHCIAGLHASTQLHDVGAHQLALDVPASVPNHRSTGLESGNFKEIRFWKSGGDSFKRLRSEEPGSAIASLCGTPPLFKAGGRSPYTQTQLRQKLPQGLLQACSTVLPLSSSLHTIRPSPLHPSPPGPTVTTWRYGGGGVWVFYHYKMSLPRGLGLPRPPAHQGASGEECITP